MDTRDYLLGQIQKLSTEVKSVMDEAEAKGTDLTDEQNGGIKERFERIEDLKVEVKRIEDRASMQAQLEALGTISEIASTPGEEMASRSVGHAVIESKAYQALIEEVKRTGQMPKFDGLVIEMKTAGDAVLESGLSGDPLAPQFDSTLRAPGNIQYPLRVADLLTISQVGTGGNTVTYPVVATRTGPSGNPTTEGQDKKGVVFDFDVASATLVKNTAFSGVSDEFFQDAPRLVSWINEQMGVMVLQDEEREIVDVIQNAITTSVDGTEIGGDAGNGFDAIRAAMASIEIAGGLPDAILAHPNDAAGLDVLKASGGDEQYYSGAPYLAPRESVWGGLRVVHSTAVPTGSPIVGAFRAGASLYRKGGLRVESSNSHDDYFLKDLVALRAYLRSVAAVHYPEWFVTAETGISS